MQYYYWYYWYTASVWFNVILGFLIIKMSSASGIQAPLTRSVIAPGTYWGHCPESPFYRFALSLFPRVLAVSNSTCINTRQRPTNSVSLYAARKVFLYLLTYLLT